MRHLVEIHRDQHIELIDGVKITFPNGDNWVLILPDAGEPLVHIYANSEDRHWVDHQLRKYQAQVMEFISEAQQDSNQHFF